MTASATTFEIFLATAPGLETWLADEVRAAGFATVKPTPGGVTLQGGWADVWRANLEIRGASKVLARIASFRVDHLAKLDKQAQRVNWAAVLRADVPIRVTATCRKSKIYHSGAAAERVAKAIVKSLGAPLSDTADVAIFVRLDHDVCTIAVDTSGELLHKRGHKEAVSKAPMRESLAALFLRQCGYDGCEPVVDPMCGSGTFVTEAAEIAAGLPPGRSRSFAFEKLATFDAGTVAQLRAGFEVRTPAHLYSGFDQDAGAVRMSTANAERAGVSEFTRFMQHPIRNLAAPDGVPGLVIINPPYGTRIGDKNHLMPLYRSIGETLKSGFHGWRVGLITTDTALANATGLPFLPTAAPVAHGGLRVRLHQTKPLP